jgi:hypothetical protein
MKVFPPNFLKNFRNICLKDKNTKYTKNLTSYSVNYLKIVLLILLILRKFSKITRIFLLKALEISKNRPKIWQFLVKPSLAKPPPPPSSLSVFGLLIGIHYDNKFREEASFLNQIVIIKVNSHVS